MYQCYIKINTCDVENWECMDEFCVILCVKLYNIAVY